MVWSVLLFCFYLGGNPFIILTNHAKIKQIVIIDFSTGSLTRWPLRLSEFEFDIVHRGCVKQKYIVPVVELFELLQTIQA